MIFGQIWCGFFFNDPATTEIYTLSLHDALPICSLFAVRARIESGPDGLFRVSQNRNSPAGPDRKEHTSELQSRRDLVCRLLLEKKKKIKSNPQHKRKKNKKKKNKKQ